MFTTISCDESSSAMRHSTLKKGNIADGTAISLSMIIIASAETHLNLYSTLVMRISS